MQSALDKLKNIMVGQLVVNSAKTPLITTLRDEHKEIYSQAELSCPNIRQLQGM
jgi:hypothetical protein